MKRHLSKLDNKEILVAPSILAADFAGLGNDIKRIEDAGADIVHVDVMDGHFVPNISIGPPVVKSIRATTELPFDVHLMISNPLQYIKAFSEAGADSITFHLESNGDSEETIREIRNTGCSVGICLKPATPAEEIFPYLEVIDLVLVMTVEPGFGGQSFMADMMPKVTAIRERIQELNKNIHLEVDGGIDENTVKTAVSAGANMLVAGTAVFKHPKGAKFAIDKLKN
jgi:ribulose-phosphate 3-epimerase